LSGNENSGALPDPTRGVWQVSTAIQQQVGTWNYYDNPKRVTSRCCQTRNNAYCEKHLPSLGLPELQRKPDNQGAQQIAQDMSPHKMCVDHLHWKNRIAKRANKRRIEIPTRFSNGKKYNNNGTEIE